MIIDDTYGYDGIRFYPDICPTLRSSRTGLKVMVNEESTYKDTWTRGELNGMKVNSFFCGAGGMDLGFIQAGFEVVGAWDFDKYAVESYTHNIGMHVEQMSVTDMKGSDVPNVNGWLFGFPCQDISVAGKQKGMIKGETRSGLFYEIMRLLGEVEDKPEWILAENVKAVNKFIPTIEEEYDKAGYVLVSPQLYNTKYWFLPQNRERFFLLGLRKDLAKTFTFPEQQTDFIPKLSSILETDVDEKYYIDDLKAAKIIEQAVEGLRVKQATKKGYDIAVEGDSINISHPNSQTRRGRVGKQVAQTLLTGTEQVVVESLKDCHGIIVDASQEKREGQYRIYEEASPTLAARDYKEPRMVIEEQPKILTIGNVNPSGRGMNGQVYDSEGLAPTCTTNKGEGVKVMTVSYNRKDGIEKEIDVAGALTSSDWRGLNQNQSKAAVVEFPRFRVRKLTPREYARLQGFPESYEQIVSNSQFYKQMGNAVSVPVAYAIAKAIKEQL
jgi:DNA (cytosine-5)-methyltransferase 1